MHLLLVYTIYNTTRKKIVLRRKNSSQNSCNFRPKIFLRLNYTVRHIKFEVCDKLILKVILVTHKSFKFEVFNILVL